jgi:hypothetical protein
MMVSHHPSSWLRRRRLRLCTPRGSKIPLHPICHHWGSTGMPCQPNENPYSHFYLGPFFPTTRSPPTQPYTSHLNLRHHLQVLYQNERHRYPRPFTPRRTHYWFTPPWLPRWFSSLGILQYPTS